MTIEQIDIEPSLGFSIKLIVFYEFMFPSFFLQDFLLIFNCLCTQVSIGAFVLKLSIRVLLFVFIIIDYLFQLSIMSSSVSIELVVFSLSMNE